VWVTGGTRRRVNQENPVMRIYIIGNDGITLCREAPAAAHVHHSDGMADRSRIGSVAEPGVTAVALLPGLALMTVSAS
jgi:hypothetical protein